MLRVVTALLSILLAVGSAHYGIVRIGYWIDHTHFWYFAGAFVGLGILLALVMKQSSFYSTLRHEMCHWLFSVLFLHKPVGISVSLQEGEYVYSGKSNYFITLAPYFFPIVTFFLLLLRLLFDNPGPLFFIVIGLAMAFDLVSSIKDYHCGQSDWRRFGRPFSVIFSATMLAFFTVLHFSILFEGFSAVPKLFKHAFRFYAQFF
ncbi:MAG TPA: hypothetical protein P5317_08555 [Myxococcota bacterium]|nr:hypothetical protein [Myxococcota bacterium]HRV18047.1 hypothetical protein [Myxococcota bacterium]